VLTDKAFQMSKRGIIPALQEAFYSPYIDWSRIADPEWTLEPLRETATDRNFNESIRDSLGYHAINLINNNARYNNLLRKGCPFLPTQPANHTQPAVAPGRTTFVVSNRGRTIRMFEHPSYAKRLKQMELTPYTAFGCLVNYLIQPRPDIFLPVYDQFRVMSDPNPAVLKISIQIRAGDHVFLPESQGALPVVDAQAVLHHYKGFFSCAAEIEQFAQEDSGDRYERIIWYLATDSHSIRRAAVALYGDKVVTSLSSTIEHTSKENFFCEPYSGAETSGGSSDAVRATSLAQGDAATADESSSSAGSAYDADNVVSAGSAGSAGGAGSAGLQYGTPREGPGKDDLHTSCAVSHTGFATAAAEWWMIGYADYHVVTESSGYGRSGGYRTGNKDNIFTIYKNQPTLCNRDGFTELDDLMYDWSGI
jgi:hypothetical protein